MIRILSIMGYAVENPLQLQLIIVKSPTLLVLCAKAQKSQQLLTSATLPAHMEPNIKTFCDTLNIKARSKMLFN